MRAETKDRHEMYADVGSKVRRLRLARGYSQAHLAALAGLSADAVGHAERGLVVPSANTVRKLALALDVSIASLIEKKERVDVEKAVA